MIREIFFNCSRKDLEKLAIAAMPPESHYSFASTVKEETDEALWSVIDGREISNEQLIINYLELKKTKG